MHVRMVTAKHFRRFTDLQIVDIPATAKLVIVAGPNGNGKSSLFDAFLRHRYKQIGIHGRADLYHSKRVAGVESYDEPNVEFHEPAPKDLGKLFYVRTAYRNEPEFRSGQINAPTSIIADHRIARLIDNDATVSANFQRMYAQALEDAFESGDENITLKEFREEVIGETGKYLQRLLPHLQLSSLGNPFKVQTFRFSKGGVKDFNYMNLSGGEKAAFDLILDYILKKKEFDDTVFCIDEPEAHLNPRLHGEMLSCLFDLTDDRSQLWIATHSIGMMRKARDIFNEKPGSVVFLDFEKDFDQPQVIAPIIPDRAFWQRSLSVALSDLSELVAPNTIIACESGKKDGAPGEGFDAEIYNMIFASGFPETRFVSIGSSTDMKGDRFLVIQAVADMIRGATVRRLIDRDGMSDQEVAEHQSQGIRVLLRRHIESYLFDDEILKRLCASTGNEQNFAALMTAKADAITASVAQGHTADDFKKAAGRLSDACRKTLTLHNAGKTSRGFMRDTLAPLVTPDTNIYAELRSAIFGI